MPQRCVLDAVVNHYWSEKAFSELWKPIRCSSPSELGQKSNFHTVVSHLARSCRQGGRRAPLCRVSFSFLWHFGLDRARRSDSNVRPELSSRVSLGNRNEDMRVRRWHGRRSLKPVPPRNDPLGSAGPRDARGSPRLWSLRTAPPPRPRSASSRIWGGEGGWPLHNELPVPSDGWFTLRRQNVRHVSAVTTWCESLSFDVEMTLFERRLRVYRRFFVRFWRPSDVSCSLDSSDEPLALASWSGHTQEDQLMSSLTGSIFKSLKLA